MPSRKDFLERHLDELVGLTMRGYLERPAGDGDFTVRVRLSMDKCRERLNQIFTELTGQTEKPAVAATPETKRQGAKP